MLVRDRNHKSIEIAAFKLFAQGIEAGFVGVHQHDNFRDLLAGTIAAP